MLINDILDLSKIESGTVVVDVGELRFRDLHDYVERTFRHVAEAKGVDFDDRARSRTCRRRCTPTPSGCSRSSRTCSPTRSSSRTTARSRFKVEPADAGLEPRQRQPQPARQSVIAFSVTDTGIGISAGEAADHLRGVPAGRRQHQPQVRRHGPGPGDQPRDRAAARRRNPAGQHAGRGQHVHALPAAGVHAAEDRRASRAGTPANGADVPLAPPVDAAAVIAEPIEPSLVNEVGDDRDNDPARRPRAADRRERPQLRPSSCWRSAREKGFKGLVTSLGAAALAHGARVQARRDHARHQPARHRRLARARPAEERSRHAAHPGLHHLHRRRPASAGCSWARWAC